MNTFLKGLSLLDAQQAFPSVLLVLELLKKMQITLTFDLVLQYHNSDLSRHICVSKYAKSVILLGESQRQTPSYRQTGSRKMPYGLQ